MMALRSVLADPMLRMLAGAILLAILLPVGEAGRPAANPKTNPIGCNVKWDGQDAHWMPPDACDLA